MRLSELSEDAIVNAITKDLVFDPRVLVGPGDDCALVRVNGRNQLLKTDCVMEGIHFLPDAPPGLVGWKAICRSISDVAAMGGEPADALVTLAVSGDRDLAWLQALYRGMRRAAARYSLNLVGGETSRSPGPVFISVALTGYLVGKRAVRRSGGKSGDLLYVTATLGGSIRGKHLRFTPRVEEAAWLAKNFPVHAMMDLSDGLASDLPRLAQASQTGFVLDLSAIPRTRGSSLEQALSDGEDYELLFSIAPRSVKSLESKWHQRFPRLRLTRIGRLQDGAPRELAFHGYDHFALHGSS